MRKRKTKPEVELSQDLKDFIIELTELSLRHGIVVTGKPEISVLEEQKNFPQYVLDADGRLRLD